MRQDLELMNVVQHCRKMFALRCVELKISSCLRRTASACSSNVFLIEAGHLSNLVPETFDVPSSGGLIESISLFKGLFQRRVLSVIRSRISMILVCQQTLHMTHVINELMQRTTLKSWRRHGTLQTDRLRLMWIISCLGIRKVYNNVGEPF